MDNRRRYWFHNLERPLICREINKGSCLKCSDDYRWEPVIFVPVFMHKSTKSLFFVRLGLYKKSAKTTEVKLIRRPVAEPRGMKTSLSLNKMIKINQVIKMNVPSSNLGLRAELSVAWSFLICSINWTFSRTKWSVFAVSCSRVSENILRDFSASRPRAPCSPRCWKFNYERPWVIDLRQGLSWLQYWDSYADSSHPFSPIMPFWHFRSRTVMPSRVSHSSEQIVHWLHWVSRALRGVK